MKFKGQYYDEGGNTQEAVVEDETKAGARAQIRALGGIVSLTEVPDHVNTTHTAGDEDAAGEVGQGTDAGAQGADASGDQPGGGQVAPDPDPAAQ